MSEYVNTRPSRSGPVLSASTAFEKVLLTASGDGASPTPSASIFKKTDSASLAGLQPAHEQPSLSKSQSAGLKDVHDMLLTNNGGLSSGTALDSPDSSLPVQTDDTGYTLGPPSTKRKVTLTRAMTAPEGVIGAPVTATLPPDVTTPAPHQTTAAYFGMAEHADSRAETALAMAKRTAGNVEILAHATRGVERRVEELEHDLGQLITEVRLRAPPGVRAGHSPSPTRGRSQGTTRARSHASTRSSSSETRSYHGGQLGEDIRELFDRVEDLDSFAQGAQGRIHALEDHVDSPKDGAPGELTAAELGTLVARRFNELTSDRDLLDGEIKYHADQQEKVNAELRLENKGLRKSLRALQDTLTRLELHMSAPTRTRSRSPIHGAPASSGRSSHSRVPRSRSPAHKIPTKRPRLPSGNEGFITVGPLVESPLAPFDYFNSLIDGALPTFTLTAPYSVSLDPVFPFHLRATLNSAKEAKDLVAAWSMGSRHIGMKEMPTNGTASDESASHAGSGHQMYPPRGRGGRGSSRYSSGGSKPRS